MCFSTFGARPPRLNHAHRSRLGCWRLRATRRSRRAARRMWNWMRRSHRAWRTTQRSCRKENSGRTAAPVLGPAIPAPRRVHRSRLLPQQIGQRGLEDRRHRRGHCEDAHVPRAQEVGGSRCSGLDSKGLSEGKRLTHDGFTSQLRSKRFTCQAKAFCARRNYRSAQNVN